MNELRPMETRRRSRSKTPFLRSSCDHDNCEQPDEEDHHHHNKKTVATASAPKVQTITEETVEVTSSSAISPNAKKAHQKIKTSDYSSSDDTSPDHSKIKSRAVIESHEKQIYTATYLTTTTTTTSSSSSTLTTKGRNAASEDNSLTAATSTPKANYVANSFAAQFATSPADILTASKGAGLAQGRCELAEATQNEINAEFEHSQQRNSMAARVNKSDNDGRHRSQKNISNSSSIRSIRRFFSNSFGGGGGGEGGSDGEDDSYNAGSLSDHIAYREYKRAGEYWKTTPKTDYTYSKLSPHRRVLAPGVVAMPNMSRRSLENHHERINYLIEHNPTRESYIRRRYESPKYTLNRRREAAKLVYDSGDEVDLIQFDSFERKESNESWFMRCITSVVTLFTKIWQAIFGAVAYPNESRFYRTKIANKKRGLFGSIAHGFRSAVYNFFRYIYLCISYVLSVDTWLLRSSNAESKGKKRFLLFLLILLPLFLLTGWQVLDASQRSAFLQTAGSLLPTTLLANVRSALTRSGAPLRELFQHSTPPTEASTIRVRSSNEKEAELYNIQEGIKKTLTLEETRNILQHINRYMQQLLDLKLKRHKQGQAAADAHISPAMALSIANVVRVQIEDYQQKEGRSVLHQLTDDDVQRIADQVQRKLKMSDAFADVKLPLTLEHLSQIRQLVAERIEVNNHQVRDTFFEHAELETLLARILKAPQLAHFVDSRFAATVDDRLLQLQEGTAVLMEGDVKRLDKQQLLIADLYQEIGRIKLALSEKFSENEKLQNSISSLQLEQEHLMQRLQTHELSTDQQFTGLLQEIETKLTSLKEQQFTLLYQELKLSLMEILGFNNTSAEGAPLDDAVLKTWVRNVFTAKDYLEQRLLEITEHSNDRIKQELDRSGMLLMREISERLKRDILTIVEAKSDENVGALRRELNPAMSEEAVRQLVKNVLAIYDADKTGLVDFALESAGGQILSTRCTESYQTKTAQMSVFGIPLWYLTNTPRVAISPNVQPGECWAFQGFPGFLVLKLNSLIYVSGFTLEHIPKSLAPNGRIESAPRNFTVWGLEHEKDQDPALFGEYEYVDSDAALQYFPLKNTSIQRAFEIVELRIESNHGHPSYTCLYRFRVHGKPITA